MTSSTLNWASSAYLLGPNRLGQSYDWISTSNLPDFVQTVGVTPSLHAAAWLVEAMNGLKRLSTLRPDWDSYGSPAVSSDALRNARVLLSAIRAENIPEPAIAPVSGGGVSIEWQSGERELEVEVLPDGAIEFLRVTSSDLAAPGALREGRISNPNAVPINLLVTWVAAG